MSKVLIFGSEGGLGQAFMEVYKDESPIGLDRDQVDVADQVLVEKVIFEYRPTLVINCAGYTAVDKAEQERELCQSINGSAPGYIAIACSKINATMVHFSTGQVFDGRNPNGYNEDDQTDPINTYGKSKLTGEIEVQKNLEKFYIIRSAWLFGKTKTGKKSFIELMLEKAKSKEPILCVTDEIGTPTYDFDLAQATRALVEVKKPVGIYHLVNSGRANRLDWAEEIFRIRGISVETEGVTSDQFPKRPAARPRFEILNNIKFIQLRPWQEALKEFLISNSPNS